jgi:hypothetical protein
MIDVDGLVDQALQLMPSIPIPSVSPCESPFFAFPAKTAHYMVKLPDDHHSQV